VDVGGTFTDIVVIKEDGSIETAKVLTTPPMFAEGIMEGLASAAKSIDSDLEGLLKRTEMIFHGTTIAENAVFTGNGSKVGLITTRGFEDTLLMARGALGRWTGLTEEEIKHVVANVKPKPIAPRTMILGLSERTDYRGHVVKPVIEAEALNAVRFLSSAGAESFAICFLWSFRNPTNETETKKAVEKLFPGKFVTLSSELAPFMGEYERTSTVALNAYVGPIASRYMESLTDRLCSRGFNGDLLVMQGYGGVLPYKEASTRAVGLIESGPAAGVKSCAYLGEVLGMNNVLACDMGGTTFKVGTITNGQVGYTYEANVGGYNFVMQKVDVVSIGAGGGSLISVDPVTRVPSVGPKSAEAVPGPVCYDRGGQVPTVTDVNLILGLMDPARFLGGKMKINKEKALSQFKVLVADPMSIDVPRAAASIYRIINAQLADLIHKVTVERGLDPREFTMFSYGGAGSIHACSVCEELDIKKVVVPFAASVNAALGCASSDVVYEYVETLPLVHPADVKQINLVFDRLKERALNALKEEGFTERNVSLERSVDMRYRLQTHELSTPLSSRNWSLRPEDLNQAAKRFGLLYEQKYGKGSAYEEAGIEMITFKLKATGRLSRYRLKAFGETGTSPRRALLEKRRAFFEADGFSLASFYDYTKMRTGNVVRGPSVVLAPTTTIVINPSWKAELDEYRNLILTRRS